MSSKSYFRPEIDVMSGYTPGEQPKIADITKLNTNENPYPPSPAVIKALRDFDGERLRLYSDPLSVELRRTIAAKFGVAVDNVIAGNGSDDILTIVFRCFCGIGRPMACLNPTYSLYPVLAQIQGAESISIPLNKDFSMPDDLLEQAAPANLLIITRPNAPTGNSFPMARMEEICRDFDGIVMIDEAYADFAEDSCIGLVKRFDNVIMSRTLSKSYCLAGLRLGFAIASEAIIDGMMKVKDSYNVDMLTQCLAKAAIEDQEYLEQTSSVIRAARKRLTEALVKLGFEVIPSQTNFVFAAPPDGDGEKYFKALREQAIIVRYFPAPETRRFVRITVGTEKQIDKLLDYTARWYYSNT